MLNPKFDASRRLPLGALAAGFGLFNLAAQAQAQTQVQTAPPATAAAAAPAASASAPGAGPAPATLSAVRVKAAIETDSTSVRATSSSIGKGNQELRDIPQSVTVVTEKLIEDRRIDTLKEALHQTAGITFQAAEGGEEDIRIRGFSLAASGDIYVDSIRDPAFYDRDTFSFDRIELLRGSASMLFGRGSTGGVVNQVSKLPFLSDASQVDLSAGTGRYVRFTGDFNLKTSDSAALRVNVMTTQADNYGNRIDKQGIAPTLRWNIGTLDEFTLSGYFLHNDNGINYGLPWIRQRGAPSATTAQDQTAANPGGLIPGTDPRTYFGAKSDYNVSDAAWATLGHTHRFADGGELKSSIRQGRYDRDLRAGAVRFFSNTNPANGPVVLTPGLDTLNASTRLTEGTNNKIQNLTTTYAQSDYSNKFGWFGVNHDVLAGIDLAHEVFNGYATPLPVLNKNVIPLTVGTTDNLNSVDESQRVTLRQAAFDAKAAGVYFQDLVQLAPAWKVLAGLRWDHFKGSYQSYQGAVVPNVALGSLTADRGRSDSLWSKRFGVLYQPSDTASFHFSYGTSFNTSGDTYQYDAAGSNTAPESSRNLELGAKVDWFDSRLSSRVALFHTTKYNERDRDSPNGTPLVAYLLSGQRHAAGVELDLAGRITPGWEVYGSYAWTPVAKIDKGNPDGTTLTGERVGERPSLTPRHSGTLWTTYQVMPQLRLGAGINARSSQTPNRNPAGIVAPKYMTGDLLAEYTINDQMAVKLNVLNVTNKLYADSLYSAHYVTGAPRSVQLTLTSRF